MYSKQLAQYVADLAYEDLPQAVIDKAKRCVRDHLACVLGAYPIPEAKMAVHWVRDLGDRSESTILGWGCRTSSRHAAFANGYLAEILEMQDGTAYGNNHPASVILPALLATAERLNLGGKAFLTAAVASYEVTNRIAASLPHDKTRAFIKTSIAGALAASLGVGKLLGLTSAQLLHALGISGLIGPLAARENMLGPSIKPCLGGQAAKAGIEAALLAQQGFTGCEEILAGMPPRHLGVCNLICEAPILERLTAGLGTKYTILDVYFKAYPAGRLAHAAIEATELLVAENDIRPEAVARIEVQTFARAAGDLGARYPTGDGNYLACLISVPYMLAVLIKDKALGPRQFSREHAADPGIVELAGKVVVSTDDLFTRAYPAQSPARVSISLTDGRVLQKQIDQPKWSPERGVPDAEHAAKFRLLAAEVLPGERIEQLDRMIDRLEELEDVSMLIGQAVA